MGQGIGDCEALMGNNHAKKISKVLPEGVAPWVIRSLAIWLVAIGRTSSIAYA